MYFLSALRFATAAECAVLQKKLKIVAGEKRISAFKTVAANLAGR
jgi:hypothetical protein